MKNNIEAPSGIVLLAKQSGRTSFSSLSVIKKALGTTKVGHTGTLDSFADGLLVVLSNRLTRLVPAITDFDKEYVALVEFGTETDTLDPTGNVIKTGKIPTKEQILSVLPDFIGEIDQKPPAFSALHVDGHRASDLARQGKNVEIPARKIHIYELELIDYKDKYALIKVRCSKGTYIRCLGRDIAQACGSCAHLAALRRTRVGPFELKDASGYEYLEPFEIDGLVSEKNPVELSKEQDEQLKLDIKTNLRKMDPFLAGFCGFKTVNLKNEYIDHFYNGRPLVFKLFDFKERLEKECKIAVFNNAGGFMGVVDFSEGRLHYVFVIPRSNFSRKMVVFNWEQIKKGDAENFFAGKSSAVTIGSFDGPHAGHLKIFDHVIGSDCSLKGIITFSRSMSGIKNSDLYTGDISTIEEKLGIFEEYGFDFAVVIVFSPDFGATCGEEFFSILKKNCNLKYLAEGQDFKCGYKGTYNINCIKDFCSRNQIEIQVVDDILFEGERISSSRIRQCIQNGNFDAAEKMLGRKISISR